ncbi:UNVERIFIED_CONTAM: hypothetical protein PYX00_001791 [Menopon gallinae]|uniref:Suppressor of cytokine signaling 7 n=1 Tax=Menopon gallinae TaxID=328185 RepID=A0AAW2IFH5_9NEOP
MVIYYHGKENLDIQISCCSSYQMEIKEMTSDVGMEQENSWKRLNNSGMCSAVNTEQLWDEFDTFKFIPLDPPPEFQDQPLTSKLNLALIEKFAANLMSKLITDALLVSCKITWSIPCSQICHMSDSGMVQDNVGHWSGLRLCWTPELLQGSSNRESSRSSLSSRLSSSHNSLITSRNDESGFITSAVSHDVLSSSQSSDTYNVPLDSDNYAVPVDVKSENPKPPLRTKKRHVRGRRFHSAELMDKVPAKSTKGRKISSQASHSATKSGYRGSELRPDSSTSEPIHLTLQEVREYMHNLYASSSNDPDSRNMQDNLRNVKNPFKSLNNNNINVANNNNLKNRENSSNNNNNSILINNYNFYNKNRKNAFGVMVKSKKAKENCENSNGGISKIDLKKSSPCRPSFSLNFKQTLCNIFRFKRLPSPEQCLGKRESHSDDVGVRLSAHDDQNPPSPITKPPFSKRALPPLPKFEENHGDIIVTDSTPLPSPEFVSTSPLRVKRYNEEQTAIDFASSIEKVKDYGWYWGPISGEAAEKILSNEPDGSFIVRDSSDDYYIFSLTFKLNSVIRHVRIEHDQGKFSFGSSHRFKSNTIVDFIESAVEHSRSGRYLFFLHRRPVLGPMRVQLLHPVSRFKQVQSLQHMCRFVILKFVRKDLIRDLPLPGRVLDYLCKQDYYSEHLVEEEEEDEEEEEESDSTFQDELSQFLCFRNEKFS